MRDDTWMPRNTFQNTNKRLALSTELFAMCHHYARKLEEKKTARFCCLEPGTEGTLMVRTCLFQPTQKTAHNPGLS